MHIGLKENASAQYVKKTKYFRYYSKTMFYAHNVLLFVACLMVRPIFFVAMLILLVWKASNKRVESCTHNSTYIVAVHACSIQKCKNLGQRFFKSETRTISRNF